jgi:phosphatidylinositol-3,4,5-trisphosphate 3-phosphatase/dual-specificity protein phosphatase PTEN
MFKSSYDAMRYYGTMRTNDKKGLTIPSQIRYVMYFEKALRNDWTITSMPSREIKLLSFKLITIPRFTSKNICNPWFTLENK